MRPRPDEPAPHADDALSLRVRAALAKSRATMADVHAFLARVDASMAESARFSKRTRDRLESMGLNVD